MSTLLCILLADFVDNFLVGYNAQQNGFECFSKCVSISIGGREEKRSFSLISRVLFRITGIAIAQCRFKYENLLLTLSTQPIGARGLKT